MPQHELTWKEMYDKAIETMHMVSQQALRLLLAFIGKEEEGKEWLRREAKRGNSQASQPVKSGRHCSAVGFFLPFSFLLCSPLSSLLSPCHALLYLVVKHTIAKVVLMA